MSLAGNISQAIVVGLVLTVGCAVPEDQLLDDIGDRDAGDAGGAGNDGALVIRPMAEILDRPLRVTEFAPDGIATLSVFTTVPISCTVVYGVTPAYGTLIHGPEGADRLGTVQELRLTRLLPATRYYYRVQGMDAHGVLYVSEVSTFDTPPLSTKMF